MSEPEVIKKSVFLSQPLGQKIVATHFGLIESDLERLVGRYSSGRFEGLLRGKITWWKIIRGGFLVDEKLIVKEKGATFGYRIVDYEEKRVFLGDPLEVDWLSDYKRFKGIHIKTDKEKEHDEEQERYRASIVATRINMIDNLFSGSVSRSLVESFSKSIVAYDEKIRNHFLNKASKWCFENNQNDLYRKINKSFQSHRDTIDSQEVEEVK